MNEAPVEAPMKDMVKCNTCGFTWAVGSNGTHSCTANMRKTIMDLQAQVTLNEYKERAPVGSRWIRSDHDPSYGAPMPYTVIHITNTEHIDPMYQPEVVYQGGNGSVWSMPLKVWPSNLVRKYSDA